MTSSAGAPMSHRVLWQHIFLFVHYLRCTCAGRLTQMPTRRLLWSQHWPLFTYVHGAECVRLEQNPVVQMLFDASWFTSVWLQCTARQSNKHTQVHIAVSEKGRDAGKCSLRHLSGIQHWGRNAQKRKCYSSEKASQVSSLWMQTMSRGTSRCVYTGPVHAFFQLHQPTSPKSSLVSLLPCKTRK